MQEIWPDEEIIDSGSTRGALAEGQSQTPAAERKVVRLEDLSDLPAWFRKYDINKDRQVSLAEWHKARRNVDEFRDWDRNDDGFITMDEAASRQRLINLGMGVHNFASAFKAFPPAARFDKNGKPLLSWRVLLLPYVGQDELYKQFKFDESWDGPNNKKLLARMPSVYASPWSSVNKDGKTTCLAVTGKGTVFESSAWPRGMPFREVPDERNTIMFVEANDTKAIYWTEPEDFPSDTKDPIAGLVQPSLKNFLAVFADGTVHLLPADIRPSTLRALFTRNGSPQKWWGQ